MRPAAAREPFDHPGWVFEPKLDGVRAIAYVAHGVCELVSREGRVLRRWPDLTAAVAGLPVDDAILDGEIACFGTDGRTDLKALLLGRDTPGFAAFDLIWLDGEDWRPYPLTERKTRLAALLQRSAIRYVDHVRGYGVDFHRAACRHDLEGIVGKWADARYEPDGRVTTWVTIGNPQYTGMPDRTAFVERSLSGRPKPARATLQIEPRSIGIPRKHAVSFGG